MDSEFLYLFQIVLSENKKQVFKVGKMIPKLISNTFMFTNKDVTLIFQRRCFDCHILYKEIINLFVQKYKQRKDIGIDFFEGDSDSMILDIQEVYLALFNIQIKCNNSKYLNNIFYSFYNYIFLICQNPEKEFRCHICNLYCKNKFTLSIHERYCHRNFYHKVKFTKETKIS
jgi:hypothetical protein